MKRRLLPLVLLFALGGCAREATVSHLAVSGVVGGAVPVAGVPVTATDHAGHRTVSGVTDGQGHYSLLLDGPGPFVLTAPFNDDGGAPAILSAALSPASGQASAVVNLDPLTTLQTQRALGAVLDGAPDAAKMAGLDAARIAAAERDVATVFAPLYAAF